jgi:hypothetical protein
MASITDVKLRIVPDVANAEIVLAYTIQWSESDISSNQPYEESASLIGDDTGVGDPVTAGGDDDLGVDLAPPGSILSANGEATLSRSFTKTIALATLNEDVKPVATNPDDIRAVVRLAPLFPSLVQVESNLVQLALN